jgi:hypothetical protein
VKQLKLIAILLLLPVIVTAQEIFTIPAVADPAHEQLPIIFVHGFNDDGRGWAIDLGNGEFAGTPGHFWQNLRYGNNQNIKTFVVQWWATQGFAYANAELGWARLFTPAEIRGQVAGVVPYNSPHPGPIGYFKDNYSPLIHLNPISSANFLTELYNNRISNNYNRNGLVEAHAQNLVDVLRTTDGFGGKLKEYRQVNIITHSAGGLDTRAMLSILNNNEDQRERERVANVIYTAPPFGGSNMAEIARIIYKPQTLDGNMFSDPWFQSAIGDKTIAEFLFFALDAYVPDPFQDVINKLINFLNVLYTTAAGLQGVFDAPALSDLRVNDLISNPVLSNILAKAIQDWRDVVSYVVGFPGDPKVWEDLIPEKAVEHLNRWAENPHTKQFVTWGEGGAKINATPPLTTAQQNFSSLANPTGLQRFDDDMAVSNVSARVLADTGPNGYMTELAGYQNLDHGGVISNVNVVGNDWVRALMTPVTRMIVSNSIKYADEANRYFIVGPTSSFQFTADPRSFTTVNNQIITSTAQGIEYRIAARTEDQIMEYSDWVSVPNQFSANFQTLIEPYDLSGERLFRMDWRSVNTHGGYEAIRHAFFAIDDMPPSLTNAEIFHVGVNNSPEIFGGMNRSFNGNRIIANNLLNIFQNNPDIGNIQNKPVTDWIIKDQSNKILLLQFDQSATVEFQWNSPLFNPETRETVNQNLSFLLNELPDGRNTLYYRARDAANNTTNTLAVTIYVDNQPPSVALNYQAPGHLDWVAGPDTPLSVIAEDLGTQFVTGSVSVPGMPQLPIDATFTFGDTDIAEQGRQAGAFGIFVPIQVTAADAVGNSTSHTFNVYYDWTPPELDLQYVGRNSLTQGNIFLQTDGTYITTENRLHFEITATTNAAGIEPIVWQAAGAESEQLRSGGPLMPQSFIRGFAYGGFVNLFNGVNTIVFSTTDDYGQNASFTVVIERVDQLFTDIERPIELIADTGTDQVTVSDDGSVFVFRNNNQIYAWRNGEISRVDENESGELANDRSRDPAVSGNGRYVYFGSRATNLVDEEVSGKNFYVKDLASGKVALLSRNRDGNPVNMNATFARFSFIQNAVTYNGRYIFFHDRYSDYIEGATNNGFDIYVVDLDPNVSGDYFDSPYELRRVSLGIGGAEGTGGGTPTVPGGSRFPSVSADGLYLTFETTHTNIFPGDNNDRADVVLTRFAGVDEEGTIDFSQITTIPLNVNNDGTISEWGARNPWIDRTGRVVVFHTFSNLVNDDTNRQGVDSDTYSSTALTDNWTTRVLKVESKSHDNQSVEGLMWSSPSVSVYEENIGARVAFISDMAQLVPGDNNDARDLFVKTETGIEAINWITPDVPAGGDLGITGGISPDGKWAWWNTNHRYPDLQYSSSGGRAIHRRHIDADPPESAPQIVQQPNNRSAYIGQSASFSVQASGFPIPAYQWYHNGMIIEGANQSVYTIPDVTLDHRGDYYVSASNKLESVNSETARLTVTSLTPLITRQLDSRTVEEGAQIALGNDAIGVAPLQFQWQHNGTDIQDNDRISGSNADTLVISAAILADAGEYRLIVANGAGADTSNTMILAVTMVSSLQYQGGIPEVYALHQNYPNPFNPSTQIRFDIPEDANIRLEIYNLIGQRVGVLVNEYRSAGYYVEQFDARHLASGIYFYRIHASNFTAVRKLMLLR